MECNKDEANRARDVAGLKLLRNDFAAAHRFAMKGLKLNPGVENINQILTICDVHSAAETKVNKDEMDWYGILLLEQTGDEAVIKKQYRKLALLLHPDKNQYSGAEAAFKLIGEAHLILLDTAKRQLHDFVRTCCNFKPTRNPSSFKQSDVPKQSPQRSAPEPTQNASTHKQSSVPNNTPKQPAPKPAQTSSTHKQSTVPNHTPNPPPPKAAQNPSTGKPSDVPNHTPKPPDQKPTQKSSSQKQSSVPKKTPKQPDTNPSQTSSTDKQNSVPNKIPKQPPSKPGQNHSTQKQSGSGANNTPTPAAQDPSTQKQSGVSKKIPKQPAPKPAPNSSTYSHPARKRYTVKQIWVPKKCNSAA